MTNFLRFCTKELQSQEIKHKSFSTGKVIQPLAFSDGKIALEYQHQQLSTENNVEGLLALEEIFES